MDYLETYAQLTTGQLLRLVREQGALTDDARRALEVELQRRGVSVEQELAREETLSQAEQAERESERQAEAEAAEEEFWWKTEFWAQLLVWAFVAAVFAILTPLYVGEFNPGTVEQLTADFLLLAVLGAVVCSALPERWRTLKVSLVIAVAAFAAASVVWVSRR